MRLLEENRGRSLYEAEHALDGRTVDVVLIPTDHARPDAVDRFLEEARTVARVGHENVVQIFNGGRAPGGAVYLAIEHFSGTSLARILATEPPLVWDRAQALLIQIASALAALHKHGVVHRDLRPESVRIAREGNREIVKLGDFGVAQLRDASADTGEGSFGAMPSYMAPELAHAAPADARADVYALGCLAVHMVTGQPPFVADSVLELLAKHQSETPPSVAKLRPAGTLPTELDAVLQRALDKDPERRFSDMTAFGDALARCRLTRRQSVRVEALAAAELAGKTGAFEADARRRSSFWNVAAVGAAVVLAILGLHLLGSAPGHVQITTVPGDAALTFNGLPVQARSPVVLDAAPGRYELVVSRPGYATARRTVDVTARATVDVPVELTRAPQAAAGAPEAEPGEQPGVEIPARSAP